MDLDTMVLNISKVIRDAIAKNQDIEKAEPINIRMSWRGNVEMFAGEISHFCYQETFQNGFVIVKEPFIIHDDDEGIGFTIAKFKIVKYEDIPDYVDNAILDKLEKKND